MGKKRDDNLDGQLGFELNGRNEIVLGESLKMYYESFFHFITVSGKARQKYCVKQEVSKPETESKSQGAMRVFYQYYGGSIEKLQQKLAKDCRVAAIKANTFCYYARELDVPVSLELRKKLFYGLVSDGKRLRFFRRAVQRQLDLLPEQRELLSVMDIEHRYQDAAKAREARLKAEEAKILTDNQINDAATDALPVSARIQEKIKETAAAHGLGDVSTRGDLSKAQVCLGILRDIALGAGRKGEA